MKKCDCKIMNTLGKYQKIWPWIGVAGYAIDGAEAVLKHTKWGKAHYKLRMLIHGAGAGLLCLGAGVHTVQAFATGKTDVPAVVSGSVIGSGILGLNYTHAAAKKIGAEAGARHAPRVLRRDGSRHGDAHFRRQAAEGVRYAGKKQTAAAAELTAAAAVVLRADVW